MALLPLLTISSFSYYNSRNALYEHEIQMVSMIANLMGESINELFEGQLKNLEAQSQDHSTRQLFKRLSNAYQQSNLSLAQFVKSAEWDQIAAEHADGIRTFHSIYEFYDAFLIDAEGNILFTVMKEEDLGTNLFTGKYGESRFTKAVQQTLKTGQASFSDIAPYGPSGRRISGFITQTITYDDQSTGVIGFQFSMKKIEAILQNNKELGKTGEAYLIGADLLERTHSQFEQGSGILKKQINTEQTRLWLEHAKGPEARQHQNKLWIYPNADGVPVLGIHLHLEALERFGVNWALVVENAEAEVFKSIRNLQNVIVSLLIVTFLVVLGLALLVTKRLVDPINQLSKWAKEVATGNLRYDEISAPNNEIGMVVESFKDVVTSFKAVADVCSSVALGDFSKSVAIKSEEDLLGKSVNQMRANLNAVVTQANTIARGDYSLTVVPLSEQDHLGNAIAAMTYSLREYAEANKKQNWLKSGQAKISETMRGEQSLETLTQNIINFLCRYVGAEIGVLYLVENASHLKMYGKYGYTPMKGLPSEFKLGESLVGQVAQEKKSMMLSAIPENLMLITSGIQSSIPKNLFIVPILLEETLKGVMELGSLHGFTALQVDWINQTLEGIAVTLHSTQSRIRTEMLLDSTRKQAEELEIQQEELKQNNEELEMQTHALRESETELHAQQEELQNTNAELEEQSRSLEEQQIVIEDKNKVLLMAQKELRAKAEALEVSGKYKSEFLANMSHELRTPLNSMLLLADSLIQNKENNLSSKQIQFAQTIHDSGIELLNLINDILDLSKVEAGKLELHIEETPLEEFPLYVQRNFEHLIRQKGLSLITTLEVPAQLSIKTDRQRVEQILKNLVSNSIKFTSEGEITLRVFIPDEDTSSSRTVAMAVSDTGLGIPVSKQKLIFEAFQQADGSTSRKYGGTGLGLSISKDYAQLLGGAIGLQSEEGKGSTFTLFLPLNENKQVVSEVAEEPLPATPSFEGNTAEELAGTDKLEDDRSRIASDDQVLLLIEDDLVFAHDVVEVAHEKGFKVLMATDGNSGLRLAHQYTPNAIILNVDLSQLDGWVVMDELKTSPDTRHIPVHFISSKDKGVKAMQMGSIGVLTKPVSRNGLELAFQKMELFLAKLIQQVLIVESDKVLREAMMDLAADTKADTFVAKTGHQACELLKTHDFDCIIMDIQLKDMSGLELLEKIKQDPDRNYPPVIVYTGQEISREDELQLSQYAKSIIIKGAKSLERLLSELTLFLHRVEATLPQSQQNKIREVYNKDLVLRGKKLLLVDDDPRNSFALTHQLEDREMFVTQVFNGKKALEELVAQPDIDLILMDIMMPEMDGYETMHEIRKQKRFANLPIIALTAKAMKDDRAKCIDAGANDYLSKPVDDINKLLSLGAFPFSGSCVFDPRILY
ncbi:response regulator [Deltaproteobacteria bacterium TL4]